MSEQPAGWGQKELRRLLEDRIGTVLAPNDAARAAELAMTVFQSVETRSEIVHTTTLDDVDERAIRQRYVRAQAYYGPAELLRRTRRTAERGPGEWELEQRI